MKSGDAFVHDVCTKFVRFVFSYTMSNQSKVKFCQLLQLAEGTDYEIEGNTPNGATSKTGEMVDGNVPNVSSQDNDLEVFPVQGEELTQLGMMSAKWIDIPATVGMSRCSLVYYSSSVIVFMFS